MVDIIIVEVKDGGAFFMNSQQENEAHATIVISVRLLYWVFLHIAPLTPLDIPELRL